MYFGLGSCDAMYCMLLQCNVSSCNANPPCAATLLRCCPSYVLHVVMSLHCIKVNVLQFNQCDVMICILVWGHVMQCIVCYCSVMCRLAMQTLLVLPPCYAAAHLMSGLRTPRRGCCAVRQPTTQRTCCAPRWRALASASGRCCALTTGAGR